MSRFNPHFDNAPQVFEAADKFKKRCLLNQESLFLDGQTLWTPKHFESLIEDFVKRPDTGKRGFYEKLADQLATCEAPSVALMTEVFWIVQLAPTNLRPETKIQAMERIWNMNPAADFPLISPYLEIPVLSGIGSAGPGYNNYFPSEMIFAVEAFADLVAKPREEREGLLEDPGAFAVWLESIPSGRGRQLYHVLCHVFFPDYFERIFSQGNKFAVARAHDIWTPALGENRPAMDDALLDLRKRLEHQYPGQVDYYELPVGTLIRQAAAPVGQGLDSEADSVGESALIGQNPSTEYSVEAVANDRPTLRHADNLILFGPPGTGKTFEMQARMKAAYDTGGDVAFVAFHPSYSYEDFIGGLRPVAAAGGTGIAVVFQKGPFLELSEKAHANPTLQFTLFIDEINRANVAKVFGELITLIEPSKRVIAGSKVEDGGAWLTVPGLAYRFGVPDNLNIVATMNTADRSIAMMDIALRRRFRFQECPPDPDKIKPATVGKVDLRALLQRLNDRLEYLLDRDHAIGHAVFMGITSLAELQQVLAQRVIPLLQEYFFEDMSKVRLALTGNEKDSVFFNSRSLSPSTLFPSAKQLFGTEARATCSTGDPSSWSEAHIMSLYGAVPATQVTLPAEASDTQSPA